MGDGQFDQTIRPRGLISDGTIPGVAESCMAPSKSPFPQARFRQFGESRAKMSVARLHGEVNRPQPLQGQCAQAFADRVAHDQGADQRRAAHRRAEQHPKMSAPVMAQTTEDERQRVQSSEFKVQSSMARPHLGTERGHLSLWGFGVEFVSCGAAPESSPRREPWGLAWKGKSRGAAKESLAVRLSPLPGLRIQCATSHGLRRGLLSDATPWLKARVLEAWHCARSEMGQF